MAVLNLKCSDLVWGWVGVEAEVLQGKDASCSDYRQPVEVQEPEAQRWHSRKAMLGFS